MHNKQHHCHFKGKPYVIYKTDKILQNQQRTKSPHVCGSYASKKIFNVQLFQCSEYCMNKFLLNKKDDIGFNIYVSTKD